MPGPEEMRTSAVDPRADSDTSRITPPAGTPSSGSPMPIRPAPAEAPARMQSEPAESEGEYPLPGRSVRDVLDEFCGDCHGPQAGDNVQGDIDYILDIDRLVDEGWIVPIDSLRSPIIQMMEDGTMPPAGIQPRPSKDDITVVTRFIDNPDFWDIVPRYD